MNVEDFELLIPLLSIGDMVTLEKDNLDELMNFFYVIGIGYKQVSDYSIIITEVKK